MSLPQHVALVSLSRRVALASLVKIAAALSKQILRDYAPLWSHPGATVQAFSKLADAPPDYWKIIIKDKLDDPGAAGYHTDEHGQPVSYVEAEPALDDTAITCSHELIEMLTDPFGNRLIAADIAAHGRCRILVEPCDPSEARSYSINGISVSDFYTPRWFDPQAAAGVRYSYLGALSGPHTLIKGGYLSFVDAKGKWWQLTWFGNAVKTEGPFNWRKKEGESLRSMVDRETRLRLAA